MKKALLSFLFVCTTLVVTAQTAVTVSSNQFTPSNITITAGETVTWTNTGGTHNVNGTQATFPNNPESFGNTVGSGWTYMHTFTIPGSYNYQCNPHFSLGMAGTVTVLLGTGILSFDNSNSGLIEVVYPNPASDFLTVEFNYSMQKELQGADLSVYDLNGNLISKTATQQEQMMLDVSGLAAGAYIVQLQKRNVILDSKKVLMN